MNHGTRHRTRPGRTVVYHMRGAGVLPSLVSVCLALRREMSGVYHNPTVCFMRVALCALRVMTHVPTANGNAREQAGLPVL